MADTIGTNTPTPEISGKQEPAKGASAPSPVDRRRWLKRLALASLVLLPLLVILGFAETRTSWLQCRWFSRLARDATYQVLEGPSPNPRFPKHGPYDERLGYTRLPEMLERADSAGFDVVSQARLSVGFQKLMDRGVFPIYLEKDRAGLVLLDTRGLPFFESLYPRRVYTGFDSVPPPVRDALLYIENRELLSPRRPNLRSCPNRRLPGKLKSLTRSATLPSNARST